MFHRADSDQFTTSWFNDPLFPSREAAAHAWQQPGVRRLVWAETCRMTLPQPAVVFDGLTMDGKDLLWNTLDDAAFSLAAVRDALTADRRALAAFRRRDAIGAAAISDYLSQWSADLGTLEAVAHDVNACTDGWRAAYYRAMTSGTRYGAPED
jgi:hypothetical protein